jgi:nucleotide-binding universal stress UspA family protein
MKSRRILVPVEYSPHCRAALELAGTVAEAFGAKLSVVHVWDRPSLVPDDVEVDHPQHGKRSVFDLVAVTARAEMDAFLEEARLPEGVEVEPHLASGEPAHVILDLVRRQKADMVVMSTHGRTGFRHFLMGSVAEKVVRLCPVPVLTVPPVQRDAAT